MNVTDGRYVYMRAAATADNEPLHEYTLMPTTMHDMFPLEEFADLKLAEPFSFTKGCSLMRTSGQWESPRFSFENLLFDLHSDPWQQQPLEDAEAEERMTGLLRTLMEECDAPLEQYERLGL